MLKIKDTPWLYKQTMTCEDAARKLKENESALNFLIRLSSTRNNYVLEVLTDDKTKSHSIRLRFDSEYIYHDAKYFSNLKTFVNHYTYNDLPCFHGDCHRLEIQPVPISLDLVDFGDQVGANPCPSYKGTYNVGAAHTKITILLTKASSTVKSQPKLLPPCPYVASFVGIGRDLDDIYVMYERLSGQQSLVDLMRGGRSLNITRILFEIAHGMQHIHRHGFVHEALQPENIMVPRKGNVRITNYGIKHLMYGNAFCFYQSPECMMNDKFDRSSDIWSYACLAWKLITRLDPHIGKKAFVLHAMVRKNKSIALRWDDLTIDETLIEILKSCQSDDQPSFEEIAQFLTDNFSEDCESHLCF